jgi:hypothetical protein
VYKDSNTSFERSHFWPLLPTVLFSFVSMATAVIFSLHRTVARKAEVIGFVNTRKQVMYSFVFDLDFQTKVYK